MFLNTSNLYVINREIKEFYMDTMFVFLLCLRAKLLLKRMGKWELKIPQIRFLKFIPGLLRYQDLHEISNICLKCGPRGRGVILLFGTTSTCGARPPTEYIRLIICISFIATYHLIEGHYHAFCATDKKRRLFWNNFLVNSIHQPIYYIKDVLVIYSNSFFNVACSWKRRSGKTLYRR